MRNGFRTNKARTAAVASKTRATKKIGIQVPVTAWSQLPIGTTVGSRARPGHPRSHLPGDALEDRRHVGEVATEKSSTKCWTPAAT